LTKMQAGSDDINITEGPGQSKSLTLSAEGHMIDFCLPANREFLSARVEVKADGGVKKVEGKAGSVNGSVKSWPVRGISWIVIDWDHDCLLNELKINLDKALKGLKVRIKVFGNNAWTPLMPVDLFSVSKAATSMNFDPVKAGRLMLEFTKESDTKGVWEPSTVNVSSVEIFASTLPVDLEVILDGEPLLSHKGMITGGEKIAIPSFAEMANDYLSRNPGTNTVPLMLKNAMPAEISLLLSDVRLAGIIRQFASGRDSIELHVGYGEEILEKIAVKRSKIVQIHFDYEADLSGERLLPYGQEKKAPLMAHLCDDRHSAAQSFSPLPENEALVGIDLYLRPARLPVTAMLAIHLDESGRPAGSPCPEGMVPFRIEEKAAISQWVPLRFHAPCSLNGNKWWVIVSVEEGELHWHLDKMKDGDGQGEVLNQIKGHPWQPRGAYWGRTRVITRGNTKPEVTFSLSRGSRSIIVKRPSGQVHLSDEELETLNGDNSDEVKLKIKSSGNGSLFINNLGIRTEITQE